MTTLTELEVLLPLNFQLVVSALIGLCFGSFSTMLLHRMPIGKGIGGRSGCPSCGHQLSWQELLPVFSYLMLLGQCRECKKRISPRYPITELLCGCLFLLIALTLRQTPILLLVPLSLACFTSFLISFYDAKTQRIPDVLTGIVAGSAFIYHAGRSLAEGESALLEPLLGAVIVGGFFGCMWVVSRGRWIGSGDIFLGIALGFLLSFMHAILMLFIAYVLGAFVAAFLLMRKRVGGDARIAFAPFMVLGTFFSLFFGTDLLRWYVSFIVG